MALPGPAPNKAFSANWGYSEAPDAVLYTTPSGGHKSIDCPFNQTTGEYTGPKTLTMTVYLWQCHTPESEFEWERAVPGNRGWQPAGK